MKKPDSCRGCPLYGDGNGFVPDRLNDSAEVFVYAQNPGANEERGERWNGQTFEPAKVEPLIGKTGYLMDTTFLPLAGLTRETVSLGNALRCRYRGSDELPPLKSPMVREALEHCHREHFRMPAKTKVIVATGEYSLYALTQHGINKYDKVGDWRGYVLPFNPVGTAREFHSNIWTPADSDIPVLVTYHLAYLFRDPTATLVTKMDWSKAVRLIKRTWPRPLPPIAFGPPDVWPNESAFDTEFVPDIKKFLCYSLYDGKTLRVSEQLDPGALIHPRPTVIMHNGPADMPFLEEMLPTGYEFEDTMHAHAVLWSDFDHDLGFLGSLYSPVNKWKHLSQINPMVYSAADAFVTWYVWKALDAELERDAGSRYVYRDIQLKLIPIIRPTDRGIRIHPERAQAAYMKRLEKMQAIEAEAQALLGWPINVGSNDQVGYQLYQVEELLKIIKGAGLR